jgi:hypothetical protein
MEGEDEKGSWAYYERIELLRLEKGEQSGKLV